MPRKSRFTSKQLIKIIAEIAADKKAKDLVVLDMRQVANFCDYFVICSGTSDRQVRAIAQGIDGDLKDKGLPVRYQQGFGDATWVILDMGDIVVHVFHESTRVFYDLERLWADAKRVEDIV